MTPAAGMERLVSRDDREAERQSGDGQATLNELPRSGPADVTSPRRGTCRETVRPRHCHPYCTPHCLKCMQLRETAGKYAVRQVLRPSHTGQVRSPAGIETTHADHRVVGIRDFYVCAVTLGDGSSRARAGTAGRTWPPRRKMAMARSAQSATAASPTGSDVSCVLLQPSAGASGHRLSHAAEQAPPTTD